MSHDEERVQAVTREVEAEIIEHMRDFQKHAPTYVAEYVDSIVGQKTIRRPKVHIHPKLAEFVREIALESRAMERRRNAA